MRYIVDQVTHTSAPIASHLDLLCAVPRFPDSGSATEKPPLGSLPCGADRPGFARSPRALPRRSDISPRRTALLRHRETTESETQPPAFVFSLVASVFRAGLCAPSHTAMILIPDTFTYLKITCDLTWIAGAVTGVRSRAWLGGARVERSHSGADSRDTASASPAHSSLMMGRLRSPRRRQQGDRARRAAWGPSAERTGWASKMLPQNHR
jgi:hypothetical protein